MLIDIELLLCKSDISEYQRMTPHDVENFSLNFFKTATPKSTTSESNPTAIKEIINLICNLLDIGIFLLRHFISDFAENLIVSERRLIS